jgi:hypothetical protein
MRPLKTIKRKIKKKLVSAKVDIPPIIKPCYLLASAPDPVGPPAPLEDFTHVCVNASQVTAAHFGIHKPHMTVMSDQMLGDLPVNLEAKNLMEGRETSVLVVTFKKYSKLHIQETLAKINYRYDRLVFLSHLQRSKITEIVTGYDLMSGKGNDKLSTGIFAVFLLRFLYSGDVIIDGFSLNSRGHSYSESNHLRLHMEMDKNSAIFLRKLNVYTSNIQCSSELGVQMWSN